MVAGAFYDAFGSYTPLLITAWLGTLISAMLVGGLGTYPKWEEYPIASPDAVERGNGELR